MYGMTMIELLTRNDPYPNLGPMEVAIMIVRDGYRHPIPDYTPEALATLIARCWYFFKNFLFFFLIIKIF